MQKAHLGSADSLDATIEILRQQLEMLENVREKPLEKRVAKVTVEDYERYLASTVDALQESLDPTKLIREGRRKGDFW